MVWDRRDRQEAILREKIAMIVLDHLSDPRLGFITITEVTLSKDKRSADVGYTVLGTEAQQRSTERALNDSSRRVQEILGRTLRMRRMPELHFVFDGGVQKENRLLSLIGEITEEREDREAVEEAAETAALAEADGDSDEQGVAGDGPEQPLAPEGDGDPDGTDAQEHGDHGAGRVPEA